MNATDYTEAIGEMLVRANQIEVWGDKEVGALFGQMLVLCQNLADDLSEMRARTVPKPFMAGVEPVGYRFEMEDERDQEARESYRLTVDKRQARRRSSTGKRYDEAADEVPF